MLLKILRDILIVFLVLLLLIANLGLYYYYKYSRDIPQIYSIKDYNPPTTTDIYDSKGRLLYRLYNQKRKVVDIESLPPRVIGAFVSAEDADFFKHRGVDFSTILRALYVNLTSGEIRQGGSTITQQVVKTFFLTPERTMERKIKEAILSFKLERHLTKKEILHLYLNQVYFGMGNYGIYEASKYFFDKTPDQLKASEAAFLASLIKAPEPFGSLKNPQRVKERQIYVIRQMAKNGFITPEEAQRAIEEGLDFKLDREEKGMSYSISFGIKRLIEEIGKERVYNGGYTVYLSIDSRVDEEVQSLLMEHLNTLNSENSPAVGSLTDKEAMGIEQDIRSQISNLREHYNDISRTFKCKTPYQNIRFGLRVTKPIADDISIKEYIEKYTKIMPVERYQIYLGIVVDVKKSSVKLYTGESVMEIKDPYLKGENRIKKNDVVFFYVDRDGIYRIAFPPIIQGAVIVIDNYTGYILAMSGGFSYTINEFNRAIQAKRQPGSSFKPILYSYAIESGKYNIVSIENDAPVEYTDPQTGRVYRPSNYDRDEFKGEMTLIDGITESKNTLSVRLALSLGLESVANFVNSLNLDTAVKPYPSLALGAFEITLYSLSRFYSALADRGIMKDLKILSSIQDERGNEILKYSPDQRQVVLPETAYIVTRMLKDVVSRGTGTAARVDGFHIAGKTGTTNNYTNAWFIGYTPEITIGVLIGRDDNKSMGRKATGGNYAAPLFARILKSPEVSRLSSSNDFSIPPSIKFINVDIHKGKRCVEDSEDCVFLPFREGFEPPEQVNETDRDLMRLEK